MSEQPRHSSAVQRALAERHQKLTVPDGVRDKIQDSIKIALIERGISENALQALEFHWKEKVTDGVYVSLRGAPKYHDNHVTQQDIGIADHYFGSVLESGMRGRHDSYGAARGGGYSTMQGQAHITLRANNVSDLAAAFGIELSKTPPSATR